MITAPSPPGRWNARRLVRAHTRNSTPAATSRIAASTNEKTPNAVRLAWVNSCAPGGTNDFWYQGRIIDTTSAAAAMPALRSSGGIARRRSASDMAPSLPEATPESVDRDVVTSMRSGRGGSSRVM